MTRILLLLFATLSLSSLVIGADDIFTLYRCGTSSSALGKKDKDLQRLKMNFLGITPKQPNDEKEEKMTTVVIPKGTRPKSPHEREQNTHGLSTFMDLGVDEFRDFCSSKGKFIWSNEVSSVKDGQGRPIFEARKDQKPNYHVTIFLREDADDIGKVWDNLARLPWKKEGALKNLVPAVQTSTTMAATHAHSSLVAAAPITTKFVSEQTTSGTGHKVVASGGQETKRHFSRSGREIMLTRIAERRKREQKNVF
ncbi:hypothetical protein J132_00902 [Termitomyces sp. J132]|nr:hypothetical protein H2248_003193 [Termitomyces sp. 'cryptogamus']KNZ75889.1 hypothetical protein J132_00902 [Termitomyces sp. J132]